MLKVSWLHRLLRITPGRMPRWVLSSSRCGGFDLLGLVGSLITFIWFFRYRTAMSLVAALVIMPVLFFAMMPIVNCERLARARRRRNECVFCGGALEKQMSENLPVCACRHNSANMSQPQDASAVARYSSPPDRE